MSFENLPSRPEQSGSHRAWLHLLDRHPESSVELHPELVTAATPAREEALFYGDWSYSGEDKALQAMAVLMPKKVRFVRAPVLKDLLALSGYRLVSDQVLGGDSEQVVARFLQEAVQLFDSGRADCLFFDDLEVGTPLWRQLEAFERQQRCLRILPRGVQAHWYLQFPDRPGDYWQQFSGKARYKLRRKLKRLDHRIFKAVGTDDIGAFVEKAARVSRNSWQGKRLGLRISDTTEERCYYQLLAEHGAFRSYVLETPEKPIAFLRGIQCGGRFIHDEIGYDREYAQYSPGTILLYRVLEDMIEHNCPEILDFGLGDAEYKQHFGNCQTESGPVVMVARRFKPAATVMLERFRSVADRKTREVLRATGLYERARQLYRRT